jgi:hypothetical protein
MLRLPVGRAMLLPDGDPLILRPLLFLRLRSSPLPWLRLLALRFFLLVLRFVVGARVLLCVARSIGS